MNFKEYIEEGSYTESNVPKSFYLAIHLFLDDERFEKLENALKSYELKGVKGIGGTNLKEFLIDWGNMREVLLIMNSEEVLKENKITRIKYDDPEYLLQNNMYALRRLFNELDSTYTSIFGKMQGYLMAVMDDRHIADNIRYNNYIDHLSYGMKHDGKVNSVNDLVKLLMENIPDERVIAKGAAWWRKVVIEGITLMGKLYSEEKEWTIEDEVLKIPKSTRMFVVISSYYKKEWEKLNSGDKAMQWFASKPAVVSYERTLKFIEDMKQYYNVQAVDGDYVDKKKTELIRKRQAARDADQKK